MKCVITYKTDVVGEPKKGYYVECDDVGLSENNKNLIKF
jgi:hypothetical protein